MSIESSFYMVYLVGERNPAYKHNTLFDAEKEAKRLSKQYNKKAYILCTLKSLQYTEYQTNDCRPDNDLPF